MTPHSPPEISAEALTLRGHPDWAPAVGAAGQIQVQHALSLIPTVTGQTAWERMRSCGFKIQWRVSWVEPRAQSDSPNMGTRKGDSTIQVLFDRPMADPLMARDNLARWFIKGGRLEVGSGWAGEIQNGRYPINKGGLKRC